MQINFTHMSMSMTCHRKWQKVMGGPLDLLLERLLDLAVDNAFCSPNVRVIHRAIPGTLPRTKVPFWSLMLRGGSTTVSSKQLIAWG
jgi:hypothetical protein